MTKPRKIKKKCPPQVPVMRYTFDEGESETVPLLDVTKRLNRQFKSMLESDSRTLRARGDRLEALAAEQAVSGVNAMLAKERLDAKLAASRSKARKVRKRKGDATRDLVEQKYKAHRDKYRTPEKQISQKIATELQYDVGSIDNIIRELKKAARI
jgi:hypothetical protein